MAVKQNIETAETMAPETAGTPDAVEQAKEEIKAMLAEAMAAAEKIVADAHEKARSIEEAASVKAAAADDGDEEVLVYLPMKKGESDLFVGVNGEGIKIKRGENVRVKKKYAEVIRASMSQDDYTMKLISQLTEEFENSKDALV